MKYLLFTIVLLAAALGLAQQPAELAPGQSVNGFPMLDATRVYRHGERIKVEEPHGVYTGWLLMDDNYFLRPARVTETERKQEPGLAGFFEVKGSLSAYIRSATSPSWQEMDFTYACDDRELKVERVELARMPDGREVIVGSHNSVCVLKPSTADHSPSATVGLAKGWLVIQGGGSLTNEVKERFVALAGGPNANFVMIPTAERDEQIDLDKMRQSFSKGFRVTHVSVLHTRDRVRANSEGFVEPLRHASGVWIDGGRQWRLVDAYLGTAVEREIKALLARGGVVGGGSAGATIQGSFLVRGTPGTPGNPDGDNMIMMAPGYETGFGLLTNSAIDQHVNTRGREGDLGPVISRHPELLGIGIDQDAAIVVHGDSFFVVSGQVAIHDGKEHDGALYYFLSSGQAFNLKTRSVEVQGEADNKYPLTLTVTSATRSPTQSGIETVGAGLLQSKDRSNPESKRVSFECNVSLYSIGSNFYPARVDGPRQIRIATRDIDSDKIHEYICKY
jgi:cyanophycinase